MKDFIKSYLLELCCSYTFVSVVGAFINMLAGTQTSNLNVLMMFIFCNIAVFVLSIHKFFENLSPLAMILIQYVLALGLCFLVVFFVSFFEPVSSGGWYELFRSFTIPYVIGAALYYFGLWTDARHQQALLSEIQERNEQKH